MKASIVDVRPQSSVRVGDPVVPAHVQGAVAVGAGFEEEDRRQQVIAAQHLHDASEVRQGGAAARKAALLPQAVGNPLVESARRPFAAGGCERNQRAAGVEEQREDRDGPLCFRNHGAGAAADGSEPRRDFAGIADGGGKQQQPDPHRQVDHDLFPDDPPLAVAQVVRLVEHHEIGCQGLAAVHRVIELVAQDFGGAHDDRRIGVLLAVAGQDSDLAGPEDR